MIESWVASLNLMSSSKMVTPNFMELRVLMAEASAMSDTRMLSPTICLNMKGLSLMLLLKILDLSNFLSVMTLGDTLDHHGKPLSMFLGEWNKQQFTFLSQNSNQVLSGFHLGGTNILCFKGLIRQLSTECLTHTLYSENFTSFCGQCL